MTDQKKPPRTRVLMLRLSEEEGAALDSEAKQDALPTGTWVRSVAVREARKRAEKRKPEGT